MFVSPMDAIHVYIQNRTTCISSHPQLEMTGLGGLTGPTGISGLVTPTFPGSGLGGQPTPGSPVGKTGLPGSAATAFSSFSQLHQHVRERIFVCFTVEATRAYYTTFMYMYNVNTCLYTYMYMYIHV